MSICFIKTEFLMVVFSRLPPKGDWESMKITRNENIQRSRKHWISSCLQKLNSDSWNVCTVMQSFTSEITYYFYHRPFLPAVQRIPSVQSMES